MEVEKGMITRGIALRNGEPSVKSDAFPLPLTFITAQFQCLLVMWALISSYLLWKTSVKALDVNCSSRVFVTMCMSHACLPHLPFVSCFYGFNVYSLGSHEV